LRIGVRKREIEALLDRRQPGDVSEGQPHHLDVGVVQITVDEGRRDDVADLVLRRAPVIAPLGSRRVGRDAGRRRTTGPTEGGQGLHVAVIQAQHLGAVTYRVRRLALGEQDLHEVKPQDDVARICHKRREQTGDDRRRHPHSLPERQRQSRTAPRGLALVRRIAGRAN